MSYITKKQRDIKKQNADRNLQRLVVAFGNFMLEKRGIKEPVTKEELTEFVSTLPK